MSRVHCLAQRFLHARSGVAAVEFALIVPIMLVLYIGAVEVSQGVAADRKLNAITTTMGDLVARLSGEVQRSTIEDYFEAATPVMRPFDADAVLQRVTIVSVNGSGSAQVTDSIGYNGATAIANGATIAIPDEVATLAEDNFVVISEAWYTYTPAMAYVTGGAIEMEKRQYYVPRALGGIDIIN